MRLIDADELITAFPCGESVRTESVRATINHMPTIEVSDKADRPFEYFEGFEDGKASVEVSEEELKGCDKVDKRFSEDAISREDAVNALIAHFIPQTYTGEQVEQASKLAWKIMANASSVIPQQKEGEWVPDPDGGFKCSNCRAEEDEFIYGTGMRYVNGESEFCPNCGARMKGNRE